MRYAVQWKRGDGVWVTFLRLTTSREADAAAANLLAQGFTARVITEGDA